MTHPPESDPLRPMLKDAQAELAKHLDEACAQEDVEDVSTAQLMRLEESLTEAAAAAKQAVSIRRRLKTRHGQTDPTASPEDEFADTPVPQRPTVDRRSSGSAPGSASADQMSAVREFRDAHGVLWRVWAVTPGLSHPDRPLANRLGEYSDGWLAFESDDGTRRCRLPHYPREWTRQSNQALEELLERAEPVKVRRKPAADDADASAG